MPWRDIRFESDPSLDHMEIVVRAPSQDEEVMELLNQLAGPEAEAVVVFDGYGNVQTLNALVSVGHCFNN